MACPRSSKRVRPLSDPAAATPPAPDTATPSTAPDPWEAFCSLAWRDLDVHRQLVASLSGAGRKSTATSIDLQHASDLVAFIMGAVVFGRGDGYADPWPSIRAALWRIRGKRYEQCARIAAINDDVDHPEREPRLEVPSAICGLYLTLLDQVRAHRRNPDTGIEVCLAAATLDLPHGSTDARQTRAGRYRRAWGALRTRFESAA